jgi:polysaccharide biosynthesis/export protein
MSRKKIASDLIIISILISTAVFFTVDICGAEEPPSIQSDSGDATYLIGANDILNIFVWKEADLTQEITVMSDGRIAFPMIGEIMAKGQTVTGLRETIKEKLKNFVSNPEVTVMVKESRSRIIYMIGKVNHPGPYNLLTDMTVLQALSTAGGFADWAETKYVMIVRRENGNEVMYRFNYNEFIAGKDLTQNINLKPNDTIVIP